jgi:hypothetical protein
MPPSWKLRAPSPIPDFPVFKQLLELLKSPEKHLDSIKYLRLDPLKTTVVPRLLLFGHIGHGKSTTANHILRESLQNPQRSTEPPQGWFHEGDKSGEKVKFLIQKKNRGSSFPIKSCGANSKRIPSNQNSAIPCTTSRSPTTLRKL